MFKLKPGQNQWFDTVVPAVGKRFYRVVEAAVQPVANMVFIDPGTFVMGSPDTELGRRVNEGPQTQVTLTKGFHMGKWGRGVSDARCAVRLSLSLTLALDGIGFRATLAPDQ